MCNENLKHAPIMPIAAKPSQYGIDPSLVKRRVAELPGMCSLRLAELFPELPPVIYPGGQDALDKLYQVAMEELRKVDMSFIKPGQSVNILASHHGFTLLGGQPYAILIKATRDAIIEKTGCKDVRLRAGVGMRFRETEEYIRRYQLDEYFGPGKTKGVAPIDEGIPIETEVVPSTVSRLSTTPTGLSTATTPMCGRSTSTGRWTKRSSPSACPMPASRPAPLTIRTWAPGPPTSPPGPSLRVPLSRANLPLRPS